MRCTHASNSGASCAVKNTTEATPCSSTASASTRAQAVENPVGFSSSS
ncbi:hypothetical protein [Pseudolysinimonas kribbensis]|nr:hypothetical protein [Pseudolysinimonas kribbensis]